MTIGYIGSYTKQNGKGIYRFELEDLKGTIKRSSNRLWNRGVYIFN